MTRRLLPLLLALGACGDASGEPMGDDAETTGTSGDATTTTTLPPGTTETTDEPTADGSSTGSVSPGASCMIGVGDCPPGQKCAPAQIEPFVIEAVCIPVPEDPLTIGETCSIEGPLLGVGMSDPCDENSFCGSIGGDLYEGECLELCTGAGDTCQLADYSCAVAFEGAMQACFPECDPLGADCQEGAGCYYVVLGDQFNCGPTLPTAGGYGAVCDGLQALCEDGHACYPEVVAAPGCDSQWCCTPFCDLTEPNTCPGMAGGEECISIYEGATPPPGLEDVGACQIPA